MTRFIVVTRGVRRRTSAVGWAGMLAVTASAAMGQAAGESGTKARQPVKAGEYTLRASAFPWSGQSSQFGQSAGGGFTFSSGGQGTVTFSGASPVTTGRDRAPNVMLGIDVDNANRDALLVVEGVEVLRADDDQGRAITLANANPGLGLPRGPGVRTEMVGLRTAEGAKSIKSMTGELILSNGAIRTLTFGADELKPGTSKRAGKVTVSIVSAEKTDKGFAVSLRVDAPSAVNSENMVERMQEASRTARFVDAELVDNDGAAHRPSSSSTGLGFGGSYASGTTYSSGRGSSTNISGGQTGPSSPELRYGWALESGRPDRVVVRVLERQPGSRRLPFKLSDVPLGGSVAR